jgi:MoxR-like ATPase
MIKTNSPTPRFGPHVSLGRNCFDVLGQEFTRRKVDGKYTTLVPAASECFAHLTPKMARTLQRIARLSRNPRTGMFVLLTGPTGCGKTTMAKTYCHLAGEPCVELTFSGDTTLTDFLSRTELVTAGAAPSTVETLGAAVEAMLAGHLLLVNEINMLPPDLLSALTQVMDTRRMTLSGITEGNREIRVHENFGIIATANPDYTGTAAMGRSLRRRFGAGLGLLPMTFLPPDEEREAVLHELGRAERNGHAKDVDDSIVDRLTTLAARLREHPEQGTYLRNRISTRTIVHWVELAAGTGLSLAEVAEHAVLGATSDDATAAALAMAKPALGTATVQPSSFLTFNLCNRPKPGQPVPIPQPPAPLADTNGNERESANIGDIGHVPIAAEGLPCLTRTTWRAALLAQGALASNRPVMLRGPTGSGKSALARTLAYLAGRHIVELSFTGETSKSDLTAVRRLRDGSTEWQRQAFLEAAANGLWVIANEYNLAYADVHSVTNGLFDQGRRITLPDGSIVHVHQDFRLIATGAADGPGVKPLNEGVENRFGAVIRLSYPPLAEEQAILGFVATDRIDRTALAAAAELAHVSRDVLDGSVHGGTATVFSQTPPDLAAAASEQLALTTAELVALAQTSGTMDDFTEHYRQAVLDDTSTDVQPVVMATLAAYGFGSPATA